MATEGLSPEAAVLKAVKRSSGLATGTGILLVALGTVSILLPHVSTLFFERLAGWLFVVAGLVQFVTVFAQEKAGRVVLYLLVSVLYVFLGIVLLNNPYEGLLALTLAIAFFFLIEGILEIVGAIGMRGAKGRGWLMVSGIAAIVLAILLWAGFPATALWAIGLLVGINLFFTGAVFIVMGGEARSAAAG